MSTFVQYTTFMSTTAPVTTSVLTSTEQATWRSFRRAARLLFAQLDRDLSRDARMAAGAFEILVILSEADRRALRMSELAEATLSSPSRITHAVERLVDLGWVERATCPSDRRGWLAVLTDSGYDALVTAVPRRVEHIRARLFDGLTEADVVALGRVSDLILARLPALASLSGGCAGE